MYPATAALCELPECEPALQHECQLHVEDFFRIYRLLNRCGLSDLNSPNERKINVAKLILHVLRLQEGC